MTKSIITATKEAIAQLRHLIAKRDAKPLGIRLSIQSKGCAGLSYNLEYCDELLEADEVIELSQDVQIIIQPKTLLFVIGTEIDYQEDIFNSGFVFNNPNARGKCGCGTSFYV